MSESSRSPSLVPFLAALALSAPASARQAFAGTVIDHPHPPGTLAGPARKAVVGQLTDDAIRDIAVLQGSEIVLLFAPDRQEWFKSSTGAHAGAFTDVAVLPGAAPGARDTLLALCPDGLVRLAWDAAERVLVGHPDPVFAGDWRNARLLQVVPASGGGGHVAAVTEDGDVVYADLDADGHGRDATLPTSVDAIAFTALDFDGGGDIEYALDDGTGLRILSATGAMIHHAVNAGSDPRLLRLPESGGTRDALVWLTSLPSIPQVLTVVRDAGPDGIGYEPAIPLASPASELALADYYGDGHLDLLALFPAHGALWVLHNQRETDAMRTFDLAGPGQTHWLDASAVCGADDAVAPALAAGDLDGDGDADAVLAGHAETSGLVRVFLSDGVDEAPLRPSPLLSGISYGEVFVEGVGTEADLGFMVLPPLELGPATHVRGAVWVQPDESSAVRSPSWTPFTVTLADAATVLGVLTGGHVGPNAGPGGPEIYRVQVWAVEQVDGTETWAGPAIAFWLRRQDMFEDPGSSGGYSAPPVIQPGGSGP